MTELDKFKRVCSRYLIISNSTYIDVIFGAILANRLDSKPVWLYIVGAPGSGKTEILQALMSSEEVILRDTVTRASLISGYLDKKTKHDESLIPQLNGKVLIIKDFTTMLQMNYKDLNETLGLLRAAYDGHCSWSFGNAPTRYYFSKFGIIAAVTNIIDQHRGILTALGERFITYRLPYVSDHEKNLRAERAMSNLSTATQEGELGVAAAKVLSKGCLTPPILSKQQRLSIIKVVQVVAKARTEVLRDRFSKSKEPDIPVAEHPTRLAKQLGDLAVGITIAREKPQVTQSEILLIQHLALDTITLKRTYLFRTLLSLHPSWTDVIEVAELMGFSDTSVSRWFQDLFLLHLVERRITLRGKHATKTHEFRILKGQMLKRILSI